MWNFWGSKSLQIEIFWRFLWNNSANSLHVYSAHIMYYGHGIQAWFYLTSTVTLSFTRAHSVDKAIPGGTYFEVCHVFKIFSWNTFTNHWKLVKFTKLNTCEKLAISCTKVSVIIMGLPIEKYCIYCASAHTHHSICKCKVASDIASTLSKFN